MKIYHNPRCRKSRETLALLREKGVEPEIIEYLTDTPSVSELSKILEMMGRKPLEVIRKGESVFKENYKGKSLSDSQWLEAMVAHPKLIERPIVVDGEKAVIGRPPENILDLPSFA